VGHARDETLTARRTPIGRADRARRRRYRLHQPLTGVHGNYLGPSIAAAGLDPANLPVADKNKMNFGSGGTMKSKAWRDTWGSGQGIGQISDAPAVAELVRRLSAELAQASDSFATRLGT
jgi:nitronate monooxygenase